MKFLGRSIARWVFGSLGFYLWGLWFGTQVSIGTSMLFGLFYVGVLTGVGLLLAGVLFLAAVSDGRIKLDTKERA